MAGILNALLNNEAKMNNPPSTKLLAHDTDEAAARIEREIRTAIEAATAKARKFKLKHFLLECLNEAKTAIERPS